MINTNGKPANTPTLFGDLSKGIPKVGGSRIDPVVRAVGRKLLQTSLYAANNQFGQRRSVNVDHSSLFKRISDKTAATIVDCRNAMQTLPDIEIAMNLLVSSILAPKDMNTCEITYSQRSKLVRSEVAQPMLEVLRTHFETHHKLKEDLSPMLKDSLFRTGSYPMLILAENTVDTIINGQQRVTMESISGELASNGRDFKHVGYLGNAPKAGEKVGPTVGLGLEGFSFDMKPKEEYSSESLLPNMSVTDNPNVLKLTRIRDRMRTDKVAMLMQRSGIRTTMESVNPADELVQSLYKTRTYTPEIQSSAPTTGSSTRATVGHPLVMKLPSECVIPVHEPSNPAKHLGYFILLDPASGSPVFKSTEEDYYRDMARNFSGNKTMASSILQEAKRFNEGLGSLDIQQTDVTRLEQIYGDVLEYELNSRLKRGVYGAGATVARPEEIYRVMLARALAGKMTQLLYVPEEMLIYVAFDYNQYGVGLSLLAKSMILAGQRASLSVASVMTELKNAVPRTRLDITLDEEDDDPSGTVEHIITEHAKLRRAGYPMFVTAPNDIVDHLQEAAVEIQVSGNTAYPSTKVDISDFSSTRTPPNIELQKDLRDRHLWSFNIPPELVDTARGAEFATSIVTNNLMLIKTVMAYQAQLTPFLEDFVRTYVLSDGILLEQLREIVRAAKRPPNVDGIETTQMDARDKIGGSQGDDVDRTIVDFLNDLQIDLPKPEGAKSKNLKEAYDEQKAYVEAMIEPWISEFTLNAELSGDLAGHTDALKGAVTMLFLRRWIRENGLMPELDELLELGENNSPGLDLMAEIDAHSSPLKVNLRDWIIKSARRKAADNAVLATVADQTGTEIGGGAGGGFGGDTGGGDAGGMGGADPFGDAGGMPGLDTEFSIDGTDGDGETAVEDESSSTETSTDADGNTTTTSSSSSSSSQS